MKLMKQFFAAAVLMSAGAFVAPAWGADRELECPRGSWCWANQSPGSVFDCVIRRGGKALLTDDSHPYCLLPGLERNPVLNASACWLDDGNRARGGRICYAYWASRGGGAFADADTQCLPSEARRDVNFVLVHPDRNEGGYSVFGLTADDVPELAHCRLETDVPPLRGDTRPDIMSLPPLVCGVGERMVMEFVGNVFAFGNCAPGGEGDMRANGLPMGLKVWHPNPAYDHLVEAERDCHAGTIPRRAKAVETRHRRGSEKCACPDATHKWVHTRGARYCVTRIGAEDPEAYKKYIGGWNEWEPELEGILANLAAGQAAYASECDIDAVRDARGSGGGSADANRRLLDAAKSDDDSDEVCALLADGADPNHRARNDAAPLHRAIADNAVQNIRLLLAAGADPNLQNSKGMTPLDRAEKLGRAEAADILKEAGGACNALSGGLCE